MEVEPGPIRKRLRRIVAYMFVFLTFFRRGVMRFCIFLVAIGVAFVVLPRVLSAEEGNTPKEWMEEYPFSTNELDLAEALRLFGINMGVGVIIDSKIENGTVQAMPVTMTAMSYLDTVCRDFGLDWYFNGATVQIFPIGDMETRIIPIKNRYAEGVLDLLKDLGIYDPRFVHRAAARTQTIRITGPREYLDTVASTISAIELSRTVDVRLRRAGVVTEYQGITPGQLSREPDAGDEPSIAN